MVGGPVYDYGLAVEWGGPYRTRAKAYVELQCFADDMRHGTEWGYSVGCRCDRCREAHNRRARDAYRRQRDGF